MAKTKLSIFLGKADLTTFADALRNPQMDGLNLLSLSEESNLYYKDSMDNRPKWLDTFFLNAIEHDTIRNKTIQAVYLKKVTVSDNTTRIFAITFGMGRNLLKLEQFEERFGIITAMNLLDSTRLRSIDCNTLNANPRSSRIQLGKTSTLSDFELDDTSDIVKNISGKIVERSFADATTTSGRQSLSISITADYLSIEEPLSTLFDIYQNNAYKEKFPGIDNTRIVKDKAEISKLNDKLIEKLNDLESLPDMTVGLLLPEIADNSQLSEFFYGKSATPHEDLDIDDLVQELHRQYPGGIDMNILQRDLITAQDDNNVRSGFWKIYRCIYVDYGMDGQQYVLNDGTWYAYNQDFAASVNNYYDNASICPITMPDCPHSVNGQSFSEGAYNDMLHKSLPSSVLWDCKLINPFQQGTFEVCDVYDKTTNSFIHVKKGNTSSKLSHLFLQGSVSGELMVMARKAREAALQKKPEMSDCISADNFSATNYAIVYAIIEENNPSDRPHLPFFSKVSFHQLGTRLQMFGYTVQLKSINWV